MVFIRFEGVSRLILNKNLSQNEAEGHGDGPTWPKSLRVLIEKSYKSWKLKNHEPTAPALLWLSAGEIEQSNIPWRLREAENPKELQRHYGELTPRVDWDKAFFQVSELEPQQV